MFTDVLAVDNGMHNKLTTERNTLGHAFHDNLPIEAFLLLIKQTPIIAT